MATSPVLACAFPPGLVSSPPSAGLLCADYSSLYMCYLPLPFLRCRLFLVRRLLPQVIWPWSGDPRPVLSSWWLAFVLGWRQHLPEMLQNTQGICLPSRNACTF